MLRFASRSVLESDRRGWITRSLGSPLNRTPCIWRRSFGLLATSVSFSSSAVSLGPGIALFMLAAVHSMLHAAGPGEMHRPSPLSIDSPGTTGLAVPVLAKSHVSRGLHHAGLQVACSPRKSILQRYSHLVRLLWLGSVLHICKWLRATTAVPRDALECTLPEHRWSLTRCTLWSLAPSRATRFQIILQRSKARARKHTSES